MFNFKQLLLLIICYELSGMQQDFFYSGESSIDKDNSKLYSFIDLNDDVQKLIVSECVELELEDKPLMTLDAGEDHWVTCIEYLSIGSKNIIASGSWDSLIRLWNLSTGNCFQVLNGHDGWITCLLDLGGGCIASASRDKRIKIWDVAKGDCIGTLPGHAGWINCLIGINDFREALVETSTNSILASAGNYGQIKIWNISTGECVRELRSDRGDVSCLLFFEVTGKSLIGNSECSGGRVMVSGFISGFIVMWDIDTGNLLHQIECTTDHVLRLVKLNEDKFISGSKSGATKIWNIFSAECLKRFEGSPCGILCFLYLDICNQDQANKVKAIAAGCWDNTIKVKDIDTGKTLNTLEGHSGWVSCLVNLTKNKEIGDGLIVSGSDDGTIKIWDIDRLRRVKLILKKYFNIEHPLALQVCLQDGPLTYNEISKIKSLFCDGAGNFDKSKFYEWLYSIHRDLRIFVMSKFGLEVV